MQDELKAKGNKAFQEGRYEEAITHFTEAIGVDPVSGCPRVVIPRSRRLREDLLLGVTLQSHRMMTLQTGGVDG